MVALAVLLVLARGALAHDLGAMVIDGVFGPGSEVHLRVMIDREHLPPELGRLPAADLASSLDFRFDGTPGLFQIGPSRGAAARPLNGSKEVVELAGRIPAGARAFTASCPLPLGQFLIRLRHAGEEETTNQWLDRGAVSRPFLLDGSPAPSASTVGATYLALGFTHIVPDGLDHILFVLGLFLMNLRVRPLLAQVTAFTVAHSITLGLSMGGVVGLPARLIEPAIALSIALIAAENLAGRLRWQRTLVVFAFGLVHGMGFAGVLREIGVPDGRFGVSLAAFNVGVELGQLAVLGAAFLAVGMWSAGKPWSRSRITVPGSLAIAAAGVYWTVTRLAA
jgi:hypothetical protein